MAERFTEEISAELGYIANSEDGGIIGTWLWKNGNMTISTKNRFLQDVISRGVLSMGVTLERGKVELNYSTSHVSTAQFTPVDLSTILAPDYLCITGEERKKGSITLPANTGRHSQVYKKAFRGYILEELKGREITIGVWFYSPSGIVCGTFNSAFKRTFNSIKNKLTKTVTTHDGVKEVPLKFKDANYFDVTRKLPPRYYLVPSWGIEATKSELFKGLES